VSPVQPGQATREAGAPQEGAHRLTRLQFALTLAVVLLAAGAALYALFGPSGVLRDSTSAPAWHPGTAPCRADPLAHVHDPGRLDVRAKCATASGLVQQVKYMPGDGDWQVTVAVDQPYHRFLTPANRGLLAVRVIPPDLPAVQLPALGQHATFYGAWVINKNLHDLAEMHPVWHIAARLLAGAAPGTTGARSPGRLRVAVRMPPTAGVGAPVTIAIRCHMVLPGKTVQASQVHLFIEVTNSEGKGVRWRAASTDSLGHAAISLVTLDAPGEFTVHIYASKSGRFETARHGLIIRRK